MGQRLSTIGFDADDTLWHNERFFQMTQAHFAGLLSDFTDRDSLLERLLAAEKRNLGHYGFGVKGFTLSMIETAIEVTGGQVPAPVIAEILDAGREMLRHPVDLLPHARRAVECARETHRILLITKGDLLDQERKLAQSGLDDLFDGVEIVSYKTPQVYSEIFARYGTVTDQGMMVGNSLRSDVLPMIEAGGWGVFVPHEHEWDMERAAPPARNDRYHSLTSLAELPDLIRLIESS
ncbi:HAD family hydrolase [uncultured Roseobacter sp.]|uniref:HAD family hydrolase n=1 Tax=uncultured Roseobacter sp. TaxID=114847 RepID=UPI0026066B70|nr:HAD family hydrolase [uncultured Roseobacter sp.]